MVKSHVIFWTISIRVWFYLFIYLLGANQKNIQLQMLKEMRDQSMCEWIYGAYLFREDLYDNGTRTVFV